MKQFIFCVYVIILCLSSYSVMSQRLDDSTIANIHEQWMIQHGRSYEHDMEKEKRFKIFKENLEYIEKFNNGNNSYKLGLNQFSDLTTEEFIASYTGLKKSRKSSLSSKVVPLNITSNIPTSIDWREKGAVTRVKIQLVCGSCWAFSAVAAIEGAIKIKTGKLIPLSEQQLVDCISFGCGGGWMEDAFKYIIQKHGIAKEIDYPYKAKVQTCKNNIERSGQITSFVEVPPNDEEQLLQAVAKQPVSVCLSVEPINFRLYKQGIFTGPCGTELNHGVTLVGYGTSEDGTKYWLIKNSWGESWGEGGYMRMQRGVSGKQGICGINTKSSYPIV